MFKNIALAAILAVAVTGSARANRCPKHMTNIDQALAGLGHGCTELSQAEINDDKYLA